MPKYRAVVVSIGKVSFPAVLLDEETTEGFQMYSSGGWLRRNEKWIQENTIDADDALVEPLLAELRGRGVELVKQEEMEASHDS